jgi:hypothetical protein
MGEMEWSALCRKYGGFSIIYNIYSIFLILAVFPTLLFVDLNYLEQLALKLSIQHTQSTAGLLPTVDLGWQ